MGFWDLICLHNVNGSASLLKLPREDRVAPALARDRGSNLAQTEGRGSGPTPKVLLDWTVMCDSSTFGIES